MFVVGIISYHTNILITEAIIVQQQQSDGMSSSSNFQFTYVSVFFDVHASKLCQLIQQNAIIC